MADPPSFDDAVSPEERQRRILDLVAAQGRVQAGQLAALFGVSEDTVRRDLRELSVQGLVQRVHGGALTPSTAVAGFGERRARGQAAKSALAAAAVRRLEPGSTILVDQSTTNLALVDALPIGADHVIITPTPEIALAALDREVRAVVLLGGRLDPLARSAAGPEVMAGLGRIRPDLCLLGACGIDPDLGVSVVDFDDAVLKRAMVEASASVMSLITADKIGTALPFRVAGLSALDILVTESSVPEDRLAPYLASGVELVIA
jgi:DeoR/GlpR family transcriptional regulator of sugar metabolism